MSRKTRRLSRDINLDLPYGNWPQTHNAAVAQRKAYKRLDRRYQMLTRQMRRMTGAAAQATDSLNKLFAAFGKDVTR